MTSSCRPLAWLLASIAQELLGRVGSAGGLSFVVNVVLFALQLLYGGAAWRSARSGLVWPGEPQHGHVALATWRQGLVVTC